MAKEASFCLLFLSSLLISCSGSLLGFSYHERGDTLTSFLQHSKVSSSQIRAFVTDHWILSTLTNSKLLVDLYLNKSQVEKFITSNPSAVSELKAQLVNFLPHLNIKSIIVSCGSECLLQNEMPLIMHALKSIHSILSDLHISKEVKISVAFPLQVLRKLNASQEHEIRRLLSFIKETKSFVMIEDNIDGELRMDDHFVQTIIKRANLAASVLPCKDVPLVLTIKSSVIPSSIEVTQFSKRVSKYLEAKRIAALYVELHTTEDSSMKELKREEEVMFHLSRREILSKFHRRKIIDNTNSPTNTVYPTNPTPVITPSDTPTIIAVPSTNPVTISPTNPAAMPVTVPSTTPVVPLAPTTPTITPAPVFNPATTPTTVPGAPPVTSYPPPVTSYPPPLGNVPVVNPQQPPPSNTNAPSIQGQSWCVAKTGAPQASLQSALDYACGNGADCSQIQQGASCYSPVTLQNHASFAFNSYYQKKPAPTSCDFGGAAMLVSSNPSSGSCIYPSSSSSSSSTSTSPMISSPTPPTQSTSTSIPPPSLTTPSPSIPTIAPPTMSTAPSSIPTAPPTSSGTFGYGTPPSVLNSSNPASGTMPDFGSDSPPIVNTTSASHPRALKPFTSCIVLMIPFVTASLSMRL